jgi:hypothetical protein
MFLSIFKILHIKFIAHGSWNVLICSRETIKTSWQKGAKFMVKHTDTCLFYALEVSHRVVYFGHLAIVPDHTSAKTCYKYSSQRNERIAATNLRLLDP